MTRLVRSLALSLFASLSCTETLSPEDFYDVWGADGVKLTLSVTMARFETSCWAGDMAIPIQVDSDRFTAIGTIQSQGGAGGTDSRAVILTGHLDGNEMRLTVDTNVLLGPFTLRRGVQTTILPCP